MPMNKNDNKNSPQFLEDVAPGIHFGYGAVNSSAGSTMCSAPPMIILGT